MTAISCETLDEVVLFNIHTELFIFYHWRIPPSLLRNFQDIKTIVMKLEGHTIRPKISPLILVTWGDDVISRGKYVIISKKATILDFLIFQNVRKNVRQKNRMKVK